MQFEYEIQESIRLEVLRMPKQESNNSREAEINLLPNNLLKEIFHKLSQGDLNHCALVCHSWKANIHPSMVDKIKDAAYRFWKSGGMLESTIASVQWYLSPIIANIKYGAEFARLTEKKSDWELAVKQYPCEYSTFFYKRACEKFAEVQFDKSMETVLGRTFALAIAIFAVRSLYIALTKEESPEEYNYSIASNYLKKKWKQFWNDISNMSEEERSKFLTPYPTAPWSPVTRSIAVYGPNVWGVWGLRGFRTERY